MTRSANDIPGYDIRYTEPADETCLRSWLTHPGELDWFPMSNEQEMEGVVKCWIGYAQYKAALTATLDGVPCGMGALFFLPYRKVAHQALVKLIVDPEHRRKGIATSLVRNLKHQARYHFGLRILYFEVYGDNPLQHILEEQGFTLFARQKRFVKIRGEYRDRTLWEVLLHG